ncbi:hypothetical protein DFH06DRAFT_1397238 [Mycena polygramma]|nr:hypothetical protein DFH06DRAFT_1397238 [Mycena polygramma]
MTAPTQALPAWLSYTTITLPQTTETSVVYLPLTYYGPSIPLDSDWTYGGLSSPVTSATSTPITTTATPTSTTASTTATPTSSNATPSGPTSSGVGAPSSQSGTSPCASASALRSACVSQVLTSAQPIDIVIFRYLVFLEHQLLASWG